MDNFVHIPRDVIIEILSRLPVKSLLRFKCVCKSWRSIITGRSFIYEHLNMALADCKRARLLIMHIDPHTRATVFSLFTNEQLKAPRNLRFHKKPQGHFRIMGPCHGLFCLYDYYENFFLWNPATREIKDIPKTPIRLPREFVNKPKNALYGFGFDWKTRDYKVIKMLWSDYKDGGGEYHVYVYTLSSNSWRKIDVALSTRIYYSFSYYNSAYVNGTYYWWARLFIVCFDISNEQLWMIHLPKIVFPPMEGDVRASTTFNEYNGSLAVFFFLQNETETWSELWTLDRHGMAVTWTKQSSVGLLKGLLTPIGILKNNWVLFVNEDEGDTIIPYDLKAKSMQIPLPVDSEIKIEGLARGTKAVFYTESLVSLGD